MQAIIMAAGKGSRLGSLTEGKPKSFVEIRGKKLIEYNLQLLKKYQVKEIILVTGYQNEEFEELAEHWGNISLVYNPFYEMMNVLGSFYMGMEQLKEDFLYLHADTLCDPAIMERLLGVEADIVLPVDYKKCDEEAMKVRSERGRIVEITKQMPPEDAEGEFIGIAAFRKEILPELKKTVKQLMKEKEFGAYFESAVQRLIDQKKYNIKTIPTNGAFWAEIDFAEDYERAKTEISTGLLHIFDEEETRTDGP